MKVLVGHSGFVGSNLLKSYQFDDVYNSSNVADAYGLNPDLLVYSGIKAEMFLANKFPESDELEIKGAITNILKINPKFLVLVSTVSVYDVSATVDESHNIDSSLLLPYGKNRRYLEEWVEDNIADFLIVRLPALYGLNLKKNFIFDFINLIPTILNESKFLDLRLKDLNFSKFYILQEHGFYKCKELNPDEKVYLKNLFLSIGFNAIYFTDSRAKYQFYNLSFLWKHIEIAISRNINILNLVTEPIEICELYNYLTCSSYENKINNIVPNQDIRTLFYRDFDGMNGYIFSKDTILKDIKDFVNNYLL